MRVWAVDASAPDGQSLRGLEPREGQALPDVILLFGGVADAAAIEAGADRHRRDEGFLDAAADWLLGTNGVPPPVRPEPASWLERARVVSASPAARFGPLPASERDIEIVDTLLLMAVPDRALLDDDALANAAVWIAGGAGSAALEKRRGRAVLSPGDFLKSGSRLEIELAKGQLCAVITTPEGKQSARLDLAVSARTKMSVKG